MGNREKLGISHDSASCADRRLGAEARDQRVSAPPILSTKGLVYYSDCRGDEAILSAVRQQLDHVRDTKPIIAVTLAPITWPRLMWGDEAIVVPFTRGYLTMFRQILIGLEALDTDIAFLVEHDLLYSREHFEFTPPRPDVVYYNQNVFKVRASDGHAAHYPCSQTSGLCANRELLVEHYRKRVALVEAHGFTRAMGFEPGTHHRAERVDDLTSETWMSAVPNIDIRHGVNLTESRWSPEQFRTKPSSWVESDRVPGWGITKGRFPEFLRDVLARKVAA